MWHRSQLRRTDGWVRPCAAAAAAVLLALAAAGRCDGADMTEKTFKEHDGPVINPDCGWVAYNYEDSYDVRRTAAGGREPFDLASVVYTRHASKAWLGPDGGYEDSAPLRLLEDWMAHKRHVAFRVYANQPDDLPPIEGPETRTFTYQRGDESREAVAYWAEDYVAGHRRLVEFLGRRLGGSPCLAFVDIGGVGNTGGEWCFSPRDAFAGAGLDDERFYGLVQAFVEMYREAFPRTRLFISYEAIAKAGRHSGDVVRLLRSHDVGLRDDGLGGWPFPHPYPLTVGWPLPSLWPRSPIVFEGAGRGGGVYGWRLQGKDPEAVLDWVLRQCPPTYLNVGGAETASQKACDDLRELLLRYGRRLGYRFVLLEAAVPAQVTRGRRTELRMLWANRGAAPCHADRRIEVSFFDDQERPVAAFGCLPRPPTGQWAAGKEVRVRAAFSVPEEVQPGAYVLKVRMLLDDPRAPAAWVKVATDGADESGRYIVGTVRVE